MNQRDIDIIKSVSEFRVLDRDQIIQLHFPNVKDKINSANRVLKRLQRDGHLTCDVTTRPYNYFPIPSTVRKGSTKISHYKAIANFIIETMRLGDLKEFQVEPKMGNKGTVEPDIFMIWNNAPVFVEIQTSNSQYAKYMKKKLDRYEDYYISEEWKKLHWQRNVKHFPYILVISDKPYEIDIPTDLKVFQATSMSDFVLRHVNNK